jgi:hypothetical protein
VGEAVSAYFTDERAAINSLKAWAEKYIKPGGTFAAIVVRPEQTGMVMLTEGDLSAAARLQVLQRAVESVTSHRPNASHRLIKWE